MDWARGEFEGGQILSSPDRNRGRPRRRYGVNAAKQAREFQPPEATLLRS